MKKIVIALMLSLGATATFAAGYSNVVSDTAGMQKTKKATRCMDFPLPPPQPVIPDLPPLPYPAIDKTQIIVEFKFTKDNQVIHSGSVTTLNGVPSSIQVGTEHTYLAKVSVEDGIKILTPGVVTDGLYASFLPTLSADKKQVTLDLNIDKNSLIKIDKVKSSAGEIQTPSTNKVSLSQILTINVDTPIELTLASYVENNQERNDTGTYKLNLIVKKGN